ncbi:MbtH protein [Nitrosospira sp. Nsp2]|uniref:MbtH family protein n=1 Tax=Nitrosospira sp. Nsp2 TaxID=136548 RepID=UPI000D310663|nr:MbtH family protein [Nitrosospira sp. Nsp2]PTR15843.1 MbtH protein [Nitrosospira sp. Nsp2]
MTSCFDREDGTFRVLVNHEEQYSIWPDWKAVPGGWNDVGIRGDKKTCLEYIEKTWTDMRPLSLRRFMDGPSTADGR